MRSFVIASLRTRWAAFLGILIASSTAVALIAACGFLLESGIRGGVAPERLAGTQIIVARDQTIVEQHGSGENAETADAGVAERRRIDLVLARQLSGLPGVVSATPEISFTTTLLSASGVPVPIRTTGESDGLSLGHSWTSATATSFRLVDGHEPTNDDEVVVDDRLARATSVAVGDHRQVVVDGRVSDVAVVGIAVHDGAALANQAALFFDDARATALYAHPGEADLIVVSADPAARGEVVRAIEQAVSGQGIVVLTGAARGEAEFLDGALASVTLIAISGSLGGIAAAVAILIVSGMLALIVQQRHREIALLRAIAATPRQVRRMITLETLIVGVFGAAIGILPARWLADAADRIWRAKGLLPNTYRSEHGILPWVCSIGLTLFVGWAAAWIAGRRASKIRPIEALGESSLPGIGFGWGRAVLSVITLGGCVMLFVVAMHIDGPIAAALVPGSVTALMILIGLTSPLITATGTRIVGLFTRLFGAAGYLASSNSASYSRRMAATVVPVVLAIAVACMTLFQQSTVNRETSRETTRRIVADQVLVSGGAGLPESTVRDVADAPGVDAAVGLRSSLVYAGDDLDSHPVRIVDGSGLGRVLDLDVRHGSLDALGHDETALSTDFADSVGAHVGGRAHLLLGDGTAANPTVVAIYDRSLGFGEALLPWVDAVDHLTTPTLDVVLANGTGEDPGALSAELSAIAGGHPGARVGGPEVIRRADDQNAQTTRWVNYLLLALVTAFASIGVINSLAMATGDRVREFALLRLVGTTRRQVLRMMRWEAFIVIVLGAVFGAIVMLGTLVPFSHAMTGHLAPSMPVPLCGAVLAGAALLALIGTVLPTRFALRSRPVDSIASRQ